MQKNRFENGQMDHGKESEKSENNGKEKIFSRLSPLLNLWPAVLVAALIAGTLPFTEPVLQEIPDLLTIDAQASETEAPEETEAETEEIQIQGNFEDGVYKGTGTGYGGDITVQVTVENGGIVSVEILSAPGETSFFLKRAQAVIDHVIKFQSWEVDVVSGATYSSKGILTAIQNALTGEKVKSETAPVQETEALEEEVFEEPEGYRDGTYYGSSRGFGGMIQVKVVISQGKIAAIEIVSASGETPSYLSSAKVVISRMISAQSPNVDTVSGATYSSGGIINAVKIALKQAAGSAVLDDLSVDENSTGTGSESILPGNGEASSSQKKPSVNKNPMPSKEGYLDGVYTGTAEGFGGDITVQVTVAGGKIISIEILEAEDETPSYLKQAEQVTERIIAAQSTEVDVVSGATWSSAGIINAVSEALTKAVPAENGTSGSTQNSGQGNIETSGSESTQQPENSMDAVLYKNGVYQASALCEDEDIFLYTVQVTAIIEEGKIAEIQVEKLDDRSDYPDDNDIYLDYAINGRTRKNVWYEGVVKQIMDTQNADQIDVVSSATYSSNAIINAAQEALQTALEEETEEVPEEAEETEGAEVPETPVETEGAEVPEAPAEMPETPAEMPETPAEMEGVQVPETESAKTSETVFHVLADFIIRRFCA